MPARVTGKLARQLRERMGLESPRKPRKPRGVAKVPKPVTEARSWSLTIVDYRPPSLNELLAANRWHRANMKKYCADLVAVQSLYIPRAESKRTVIITLTRAGHGKKIDPDNGRKCVLDALVKCGLLMDDAEEWCSCPDPIQVRGENCSTTIELREAPE